MHFDTKTIRAGQDPDPATGAVVLPIHPSVNYAFHEIDKPSAFEYSRTSNPTRAALEMCLASLEEAEHGLVFGSGMAACDGVLSLLRPGDHVVSATQIYGGSFRMFESIYKPRGIEFTYVDAGDPDNIARALGPQTKLIWIESPANPLLEIVDIRAIGRLARAHGAALVVDNTFATPCFQRPLTLGADVVLHSMTKYIGGHSDVLGGAVLTSRDDLYKAFKFYQNAAGAVLGPFECWLALRGIKTLAVRMRQHERNALSIARFLEGHPLVERVMYPGLPSHPGHALAREQMSGFGGIVTFQIAGGLEAANRLVKRLRYFIFAESLGGVESLARHRATMSHGSMSEEERLRVGITGGTLRLSVGIEDERDLLADLEQALEAVVETR